ncbi:MAG: M56 family metallopeptidase [Oscillospiraceae bacterium]|jgi:beta-lactamase regulating signal transducer with metallopeptidase domain|nr:M56 family metallopeptidase [Oscillospiraceae bacterium]
MTELFTAVLGMSASAGIAAFAVLPARFLLRRAPKIFSRALWAVVLFRMVCPVSLVSVFGVLPARIDVLPQSVSGLPDTDSAEASDEVGLGRPTYAGEPQTAVSRSLNPTQILTAVWLCGVAGMLMYAVTGCLRVKRRVFGATRVRENIYETDHIATAFVLGFLRPRIYIPAGLDESRLPYILHHERTHIRRRDYLIKPIAFLALSIHWFNPVLWLAYFLMARDMEMSCDEAVLRGADEDARVGYSTALLCLSAPRIGLANPLMFGAGSVRSRVKNVLNFRKPAVRTVAISAVLVAALMIALGANRAGTVNAPRSKPERIPFVTVGGTYSKFSSSWGLGLDIDASVGLPEDYVVGWEVSEGTLSKWDDAEKKAVPITDTVTVNEFLATASGDYGGGAVIWTPDSWELGRVVFVSAYLFAGADPDPLTLYTLALDYHDEIQGYAAVPESPSA